MKQALKRFPKTISGNLVVRPLEAGDEAPLAEFFKSIPVDERHLFKDDVTNPMVIQGWTKSIDYQRVFPLIVFDGSAVVGDATLHREMAGWSKHVAKVRVSLHPKYRRRGLARILVKEFIELAPLIRVALIQAEMLDVQKGAIQLFEELHFTCVATLPQYAIDLSGRVHDILVYNLAVTPPEKMAPEASIAEGDADVGGAG